MAEKCPCSMTALELLLANLEIEKPQRMVLIVDRGNGWDVTLELTETTLVRLRREPDDGQPGPDNAWYGR